MSALELITKDKNTFDKYELITKLVNYNIINEYKIFDSKEIEVSKWIATNFIKAKAKLELLFMNNLSLQLDELLESKGFSFSQSSNIFLNTSDMGENIDINLVYKARKNRIKSYNGNKDETYKTNMRDASLTLLVHENIISDNESWGIFISNDIIGLRTFYYHIKNEEIINDFNETVVNLLDSNEFYSPQINNFLDENYLTEKINQCTNKILAGLKEINI